MVYFKVKRSEQDVFVFECTCDTLFDAVIRAVVPIHNLRVRLRLILSEGRELALHGFARPPPSENSEDIEEEEEEGERVPRRRQDPSETESESESAPTGNRIGVPPSEPAVATLQKELQNIEELLSPTLALSRPPTPVTLESLTESLNLFRAAVTIAYPMGLPPYDPLNTLMNDESFTCRDFHDPETADLWFAGSQLQRMNPVSSIRSVGTNERSRIIVKLQNQGRGAPPSEPVVTPEMQKELLAYHFRKQEEHKKLMLNDDDSFLDSQWADPDGMKRSFQGLGKITFK